MSENKPVVGFIGVGPMGHGMAANILKGGYPLFVKGNRNRTPVDDLVAKGATEAVTVAEMAKACDIIHMCLSNSPQVEATLRGPDGIIANGKAGLIVVDCTTADPVSTEALAGELAAAGMAMVDAPLGRTPKEAEEGTLDAMVGADDATYAKVLPVIECWAANINRIGPVGSAHKMKLIMNFIGMGYAALYGEAITLGAKAGIPPQTVRTVIGSSRMTNGFFDTYMRYVCDRDANAHIFSITNAAKDVRYVANMAAANDVMNIMGAAVKQYFTHADATGKGGQNVPQISDHIGALSGIDIAEAVKKASE